MSDIICEKKMGSSFDRSHAINVDCNNSLTAKINVALAAGNKKLAFKLCNEHLENNPNDATAHIQKNKKCARET